MPRARRAWARRVVRSYSCAYVSEVPPWIRAVRCGVFRARRAGHDPSPSLRIYGPLRRGEPEQPGGVLLEDLRLDLVLDRQLREVAEPAVWGEEGGTRAEEDLVLEQGVGVLHELRREVLRRPAGQVDVHARLVGGDGEGLVLPGEGRVRQDDLEVREVGGDVVHVEGVGVLEADATPAGDSC